MLDTRFFKNAGPFSLQEVADKIGCEIFPAQNKNSDPTKLMISNIATLTAAGTGELSFFSNSKYIEDFKTSKADVCITSEQYIEIAPQGMSLLIAKNPHYAYALATQYFYPPEYTTQKGISDKAIVSSSATLGKNVTIEPGAVIEDGVSIGDASIIGSNSVIKKGVVLGRNCKIGPNNTISHAIIGDDFLSLPGVTIGQDGFGFATNNGRHYKIPHTGRVIIGNDVEVGANAAIDRGSANDTVIGDLCRIDNLVQIGHNVEIGKGSVIVAQVGIAGSTRIGNYCVVGGQVGIAGHLNIGDGVQIAAKSGLLQDVMPGQVIGGIPAMPLRDWQKQAIMLKRMVQGKKVKA